MWEVIENYKTLKKYKNIKPLPDMKARLDKVLLSEQDNTDDIISSAAGAELNQPSWLELHGRLG